MKRGIKKAALKVADRMSEDVEQLDEISANLALTASQKADEMRRKASLAGDRETAAKKAQQASNLYKGVGARRARERMAEEEVENVKEEASMSPQEIQLQKRKAQLDKMIAQKRQQALSKAKPSEAPAKAMGEATYPSDFKKRVLLLLPKRLADLCSMINP